MPVKYSVKDTKTGRELVLESAWDDSIAEYMARNHITNLQVNYAKGFIGDDVRFLPKLPFLEGLHMIFYHIKDISPIHDLVNLRRLGLGCPVKTVVDFTCFPHIEGCSIMRSVKTKGLSTAYSLKSLGLNPYSQKDLSELSGLVNLESLSISQSRLTSLEGLENLTKLTKLGIHMLSYLISLHGIESLAQLEELDVVTCKKINSIEEVHSLTSLRLLAIDNCGEIGSLHPVVGLNKLEKVFFTESTNILDGDLSPLASLPHLKRVAFMDRKHYSHRCTPELDGVVAK